MHSSHTHSTQVYFYSISCAFYTARIILQSVLIILLLYLYCTINCAVQVHKYILLILLFGKHIYIPTAQSSAHYSIYIYNIYTRGISSDIIFSLSSIQIKQYWFFKETTTRPWAGPDSEIKKQLHTPTCCLCAYCLLYLHIRI